jgi:ABC-2 type transport system ATP-binding protein
VIDFDHVALTRVSRHYGRRRALHDVTFTARAGEVIALVGPNGAGKSTLLAILSTLVSPSSGDVLYGGHTAERSGAALRRCIGWLGHDLQLYPELTARENLLFFARLSAAPTPAARVDRALASADLIERADDLVSSFSRGMRQRLALERALIHDPRLVLLDEPFTGLDRVSTHRLAARLRTIAGEGRLVVLATHDVLLSEELVTSAVSLREGRLLALIPGGEWAEDLRRAPGEAR